MFKRILVWGGGALLAVVVLAAVFGGSGAGDDRGDRAAQAGAHRTGTTQHTEVDGPAAKAAAAPAPDNHSRTRNGPITWGNWRATTNLTVKDDGLGDYGLDFRAQNTGGSADQGLFTVTLMKGADVLGTLDCTTPDEVPPGGDTTVSCFSGDDFTPGWDDVIVEDSF